MRVFTAEEVNDTFEQQATEKMSATHSLEEFQNYDDFEKHQFEKRKPVWIDALTLVSGCKKRNDLELQWDLFGEIFRKFHSEHMGWLVDPLSCPPDIREARETELEKILNSFVEDKKCYWKRNHEFICFCNRDR